jgi:hypothetical protein
MSRLHIEAQGTLFATKWQIGAPTIPLGGPRGEITEFSRASRRRLLKKMARLTVHKHATFLTLTYPERFPDGKRAKENLRAFVERLRRRFPKASAIWRLEYQERGAPHFHLIIFNMPYVPWYRIRRWWIDIINEYVDKWYPRIKVEAIRSKRGAMHYISKYIAKLPDETPPLSSAEGATAAEGGSIFIPVTYLHEGRFWGVFNRGHLPYAPRSYIVIRIETGKAFYDLKRTMRRIWPRLNQTRTKGGVIFTDNAYRLHNYAMTLALADINNEFGSYLIQIGDGHGKGSLETTLRISV